VRGEDTISRRPAEADDASLLAGAAQGDAAAFAAIVRRHFAPVFRLVWRMTGGGADSEDMAQEAFLKLWQNPQQIREGAALKGWLMRVAANAVIDRSRRRSRGEVAIEEVPEVADPAGPADDELARHRAALVIDRHLARLPERQRLALSLVYFEGLSNIETAESMETTIEAVESLLARARRTLREELKGEWREVLDAINAGSK